MSIENLDETIKRDDDLGTPPQSRVEKVLMQETIKPQSRIEKLLLEGGGGTSDVQDIIVTMNPSTYVITIYLVDGDGNRIGTERTIDIPLEATIVDASYNNTNKVITFTLTSGAYLSVPIGDIIYGLQPLIDSNHKLSSSLVDDSLSRLKFIYTGTSAQYAIDGPSLPVGTPVIIADDTDIDSVPTQGSSNPVTSDCVYTALNGKVDKVSDKQLSTEDYTTSEKNKLSGLTNDYTNHTNKPSVNNVTLNGNKTSSDLGLQAAITASNKLIADLVDDANATNKFMTAAEKTKLSGIETGANKTIVDSTLDSSSTNPISNRAVANRCAALQESIMDAWDVIATKEAKADHVIISKSAFDALVSKTAKLYYVYADPVVNSLQSPSLNTSLSPDNEPSEEAMSEEVPADDSSER